MAMFQKVKYPNVCKIALNEYEWSVAGRNNVSYMVLFLGVCLGKMASGRIPDCLMLFRP